MNYSNPAVGRAPKDRRKIAVIGTGLVGTSLAYAALNQSICDEILLIDIDVRRAEGEAMDLNHGLAFAPSSPLITAGGYSLCADADIAVVTAGAPQKPGESRIDLFERNAAIIRDIIPQITASGFEGIFLIVTNPVDLMTRLTLEVSGFDFRRVIGTGTTLDTARLRYLLGRYFRIDSRNIHAYVIGEHGDSEFVAWSQAMVATKPVLSVVDDNPDRYCYEDLLKFADEVRHAASRIIEYKKATYYGVGMALARIIKAIFGDENSVLTVSTLLNGEYGRRDVCVGTPCTVNRGGIGEHIVLPLTEYELATLNSSCDFLKSVYSRSFSGASV